MQPVYLNVELWRLVLAAIGGVLVWLANNWYQRRLDYFLRKQDLYSELLVRVGSLYKSPSELGVQDERARLLDQYRKSWLYASDGVVRAASQLMDTLTIKDTPKDLATQVNGLSEKALNGLREKALAELVAAMRRDLMAKWLWLPGTPRTKLSASDFRHMKV